MLFWQPSELGGFDAAVVNVGFTKTSNQLDFMYVVTHSIISVTSKADAAIHEDMIEAFEMSLKCRCKTS
jgi:hypothetical protein